MRRAFLYKISSRFKKLKTHLEDATSFNIKMSKSELKNSILEDENNLLRKVAQEKNNQICKKTAVELAILSDVLVVNANQRLG